MKLIPLYIALQVAEALFKDMGFSAASAEAGHYAYCVGVAILVLAPFVFIYGFIKDDK